MKRGLTIQEAAAHCGISVSCFRSWIRDGLIPGPWSGTKRYDKKALDDALDKLSKLEQNLPTNAYDAWKEKDYDNKTETHQVNEEGSE